MFLRLGMVWAPNTPGVSLSGCPHCHPAVQVRSPSGCRLTSVSKDKWLSREWPASFGAGLSES